MIRSLAYILTVLFLTSVGCGELSEKESGDIRLIPLSTQNIFDSKCTGCHAGPDGSGSLDLEESAAFSQTVNRTSSQTSLKRILPGDTTQSYLFQKVIPVSASRLNSRMPLSGSYLTIAETDTLRTWIINGAKPR